MTVGVVCHRGSSGHRTAGGGCHRAANDHKTWGGCYHRYQNGGGGCYYCLDDRRTFLGMSGHCHVPNDHVSSVARGSRDLADPLQAYHLGHCPTGKKAREMEAPSSPHPAVVCHCVACQKEDWAADAEIDIWSDVGSDMVICADEGTYGGALTDVVNGAFEEKSDDGGVFLVIGRADVHVGCPECCRRSVSGASSLANDASGGADDGTNHLCCTSYHFFSYDHCCYFSYYGVCSCPFCLGSGVCGCYGDGWSGGRACADLIRVSSCPHSGMFDEDLV